MLKLKRKAAKTNKLIGELSIQKSAKVCPSGEP